MRSGESLGVLYWGKRAVTGMNLEETRAAAVLVAIVVLKKNFRYM